MKEPTIGDVLDAVNSFAEHTEQRFDKLESRFDGLEGRFDGLETRVIKIEATMVTKNYLDDKLADLRGDMNFQLRAIGA